MFNELLTRNESRNLRGGQQSNFIEQIYDCVPLLHEVDWTTGGLAEVLLIFKFSATVNVHHSAMDFPNSVYL